MRDRIKVCFKCHEPKEVLYRCRYLQLEDWMFFCKDSLKEVKNQFEDTYQYGGTWKSERQ